MSPEGGSPKAADGGFDERKPQWSPDGNSLLFQREPPSKGGVAGRASRLYLLDLTTKRVSPVAGSEGLNSFAWSPDGRYVAATSSDARKLLLFDFQSHRWSELAHGAGIAAGPFWSRNVARIYYQDLWQGTVQPIFRVGVVDRKVELVVTSKQILRPNALGYGLVGLAPDDSPVATLLLGDSDIFALDVNFP